MQYIVKNITVIEYILHVSVDMYMYAILLNDGLLGILKSNFFAIQSVLWSLNKL